MELYSRKCDVTGVGMNEGWVVLDGNMYIANDDKAVRWCTDNGYNSLNDAYEDRAIYYTEWTDKEWADNGSGGLVPVVLGEYSGHLKEGVMEWEGGSCSGEFQVVDGFYVHDMGSYVVIAL